MVYVTGLDDIDDALLKWLAEYTKAHPWRFVYLENTQTSWNFSENRDRCVYDHAPPPVERGIRSEDDLKRTAVKQLRPTHTQVKFIDLRNCSVELDEIFGVQNEREIQIGLQVYMYRGGNIYKQKRARARTENSACSHAECTREHTRTLSLMYTHSHPHSLSLARTYTHTHTHTRTCTHTYTHTQPYPRVATHCEKLNKKESGIQDMCWTDLSVCMFIRVSARM